MRFSQSSQKSHVIIDESDASDLEIIAYSSPHQHRALTAPITRDPPKEAKSSSSPNERVTNPQNTHNLPNFPLKTMKSCQRCRTELPPIHGDPALYDVSMALRAYVYHGQMYDQAVELSKETAAAKSYLSPINFSSLTTSKRVSPSAEAAKAPPLVCRPDQRLLPLLPQDAKCCGKTPRSTSYPARLASEMPTGPIDCADAPYIVHVSPDSAVRDLFPEHCSQWWASKERQHAYRNYPSIQCHPHLTAAAWDATQQELLDTPNDTNNTDVMATLATLRKTYEDYQKQYIQLMLGKKPLDPSPSTSSPNSLSFYTQPLLDLMQPSTAVETDILQLFSKILKRLAYSIAGSSHLEVRRIHDHNHPCHGEFGVFATQDICVPTDGQLERFLSSFSTSHRKEASSPTESATEQPQDLSIMEPECPMVFSLARPALDFPFYDPKVRLDPFILGQCIGTYSGVLLPSFDTLTTAPHKPVPPPSKKKAAKPKQKKSVEKPVYTGRLARKSTASSASSASRALPQPSTGIRVGYGSDAASDGDSDGSSDGEAYVQERKSGKMDNSEKKNPKCDKVGSKVEGNEDTARVINDPFQEMTSLLMEWCWSHGHSVSEHDINSILHQQAYQMDLIEGPPMLPPNVAQSEAFSEASPRNTLWIIDSRRFGGQLRCMNDYRGISYSPNCVFVIVREEVTEDTEHGYHEEPGKLSIFPKILVFPIRPIKAGEEIVVDYGANYVCDMLGDVLKANEDFSMTLLDTEQERRSDAHDDSEYSEDSDVVRRRKGSKRKRRGVKAAPREGIEEAVSNALTGVELYHAFALDTYAASLKKKHSRSAVSATPAVSAAAVVSESMSIPRAAGSPRAGTDADRVSGKPSGSPIPSVIPADMATALSQSPSRFAGMRLTDMPWSKRAQRSGADGERSPDIGGENDPVDSRATEVHSPPQRSARVSLISRTDAQGRELRLNFHSHVSPRHEERKGDVRDVPMTRKRYFKTQGTKDAPIELE